MPHDDMDWSVAARCVAERCKIYNYRDHSELIMILKDTGKSPEEAMNAMVLAWENYLSNMTRMEFRYGSAIAFFRSPVWASEELWPWIRATPRPNASLGVYKSPEKGLQDTNEWVNKWRAEHGMPPL